MEVCDEPQEEESLQHSSPWPIRRDTTQPHGQGLPQNNLPLLHWQMLLLLLVTGYRSCPAPHFPVNFKVNSQQEKREGRAAAGVWDFPGWQEPEDWNRPPFSTGALWGFTSPSTGASWVYSEGKNTPAPNLIVHASRWRLLASASDAVYSLRNTDTEPQTSFNLFLFGPYIPV